MPNQKWCAHNKLVHHARVLTQGIVAVFEKNGGLLVKKKTVPRYLGSLPVKT